MYIKSDKQIQRQREVMLFDDKVKELKLPEILGIELNSPSKRMMNATLILNSNNLKKQIGSNVAPGTIGSNFSETISIAALELFHKGKSKYQIIQQIWNNVNNLTNKQLKNSPILKLSISLNIDTSIYEFIDVDKTNVLFGFVTKLIQAINIAEKKYDRLKNKINILISKKIIDSDFNLYIFGGDQSSLNQQINLIISGGKLYLHNGVQVDKKDVIQLIKDSGGGYNPTDTAAFIVDKNNNITFIFWSDKMNQKAFMGNSTLQYQLNKTTNILQGVNFVQGEQIKKICLEEVEMYNQLIFLNQNQYSNITTNFARQLVKKKDRDIILAIEKQKNSFGQNSKKTSTLIKNINKAILGNNKKPSTTLQNNILKFEKQSGIVLNLDSDYDIIPKIKLIEYLIRTSPNKQGTGDQRKVINKICQFIEGLDIQKGLSGVRLETINLIKKRIEMLNKYKILYNNKQYLAGDFSELKYLWEILGLYLIVNDGYIKGEPCSMMSECFQLQMGELSVDNQIMKKAMCLNSFQQYIDKIELKQINSYMFSRDNSDLITGVNVQFNYKNSDLDFAKISYRAKQGQQSKTSLFVTWGKVMQDNFKNNQ